MTVHNPINPIIAQARKEEETALAATATPNITSDPIATPEDISFALTETLKSSGSAVEDALFAVQESLAKSSARINESVKQLEAGAKQTRTTTDIIQKSISDITSANQTVQLTKDTAGLEAQNNTIAAFEAGGGTELQVELMSSLQEDIRRVNDLQAEKADILDDEHTGIGVIDNIINQFRHQSVSVELQAAEREQATTSNQIQQLGAATESFARANALTKETINQGTIEANYKRLGAEGNAKAAEAELRSINSNATAMTNLVQADQRQVSNLLSVYRLENETADRAIKVERQKFLREQMVQEREVWKTQLPKAQADLEASQLRLKQAKTLGPTQIAQAEHNLAQSVKRANDAIALEDSLVQQTQRGQALAGVPVEDRSTIVWGLNQSGEQGRRYDKMHELGGANDAILGHTPAEAKSNLSIVAPSGNFKQNRATRLLDDIDQKVSEAAKLQGFVVPKTEEGLKALYNKVADEYIAGKAINIVTGDKSNPFVAPPFTILEQTADVASTVLYQKVLKPMAMKETNPQTIVDASIAAVIAKIISPEEAATGIEAIFDAAALNNSTQDGGLRRIGLLNQTTYNTQLERPPTFFEELKVNIAPRRTFEAFGLSTKKDDLFPRARITVDLMNRTKVQEVIIKLLSSSPAAAPTAKTVSNP